MDEVLELDDFAGNIIQMTRDLDYMLHAQGLDIPLLDGFQLLESDDPQIVLLATKDDYIEQVTSDGYAEAGTFDKRIESVISTTKQFMKDSGCEDVDNCFRFYKETEKEKFNFKTYVCDMIIPIKGDKLLTRQFISYFYEPVIQDFYQITVSSAPVKMPSKEILLGKIDLDNDKVTSKLNKYMDEIIEKFDYKTD